MKIKPHHLIHLPTVYTQWLDARCGTSVGVAYEFLYIIYIHHVYYDNPLFSYNSLLIMSAITLIHIINPCLCIYVYILNEHQYIAVFLV